MESAPAPAWQDSASSLKLLSKRSWDKTSTAGGFGSFKKKMLAKCGFDVSLYIDRYVIIYINLYIDR